MSSGECLREKFHRQSFVYFACFVVPPEKFLSQYPDVVVNGCRFVFLPKRIGDRELNEKVSLLLIL